MKLISANSAKLLSVEATNQWGLNHFALIEAAGRLSADAVVKQFPEHFKRNPRVIAFCGHETSASCTMVMLRSLILSGVISVSQAALVITKLPVRTDRDVWSESFHALVKMFVPCFLWDPSVYRLLDDTNILLDGVSSAENNSALTESQVKMVEMINKNQKLIVFSVGVPSGASEMWERGMPIIESDATVAVEPLDPILYWPSIRPFAGTIIPVTGLYPSNLIESFKGPELLDWNAAKTRILSIAPDSYKYTRGVVEIRAGSVGTAGAARIAARGAQAAGAGLVRLIVDPDIYPVVASSADGIMVSPSDEEPFHPDAVLVGPGWGQSSDRNHILEKCLVQESHGIPLVLDADAIALARSLRFHGNALFTPHLGEFAVLAGIDIEDSRSRLIDRVQALAKTKNAVILLKGHTLCVAAPDGRLGFVDGMSPVLATGGTGDLLAGICTALAARSNRAGSVDLFSCAMVAATLLIEASKSFTCFIDPMELAGTVASLAGSAWL